MKSLNLNKKNLFLFIISIFFSSSLLSEEVDIWKKENLDKKIISNNSSNISVDQNQSKINVNQEIKTNIILSDNALTDSKNSVYGIFEPEQNNLTLDMWVNSEGTRVKDTIERIEKIKLSSFSEELLINTLFTISYLPGRNMTDEEFINYKINWLIKNKRNDLISSFLNKNNDFPNKEKIIRYLVDENISKGNIQDACEKTNLIDNSVKDNYLDKFRVICLINFNKKNEAQLVHDLLKEQKLSDKFFDDKTNYLLGIVEKKDNKIDDTSLLNFYLSSITVENFDYKPNKKTNKKIWQYITSANLLKFEDYENKEFINELEIAADLGSLEFSYILDIYKNIKFSLNDFLDVDNNYKKLHPVDSRALIFQKILLSDNTDNKLKYLFLLNDLYKENKLQNIFRNFLSDQLIEIKKEGIPLGYATLIENNIILEEKEIPKKIRYNDDKYYSSRILKFYTEKDPSLNKLSKDFENVYKKIKKNKKYEVSIKDAMLFESLENNKFVLPDDINYANIKKDNSAPIELINMVKNKEVGLLLLRIVELVGEDEIADLDTQTLYFINHLFLEAGLKKLNEKILLMTLPERV